MEYLKFYDALLSNRLITPIWKEVLKIIENELENNENKDDYLILFCIMFSLMNDGNICMSLNKQKLLEKWTTKMSGMKILLGEQESLNEEDYEYALSKSKEIIDRSLDIVNETNLASVVSKNKFFEIEDNWLYLRKNNVARKSLLKSLDRLFTTDFPSEPFDYKTYSNRTLRDGQAAAVQKGLSKNLVITGGPGTGKTTSIFYILFGLLKQHKYEKIYLLAPSGKASSRMKDSIGGEVSMIKEEYRAKYDEIISRIARLEKSTIHSALGIDRNTGTFIHDEEHQFENNSIFVIDEASMIDICLFASLLKAIPDDGRVFIMGDKCQLPSVDAGAVFGDLLEKKSLIDGDNVCKLGEAVRFKEGSQIYNLAAAINNDDIPLPEIEWRDEFLKIEERESEDSNPVYYFLNPTERVKEKENILNSVLRFAKKYYVGLQDECANLDPSNIEQFGLLYDKVVKNASILSAENRGVRGVETINSFIKEHFIDHKKTTSVNGYFTGEIMMVNKNNKKLDLNNGDSGVLVTFKDDTTLYFMTEKETNLIKTDGKVNDKIFKLGKCIFYPFRLIARNEINDAYAITIHKSQGSDYKNILVILPTKKGHPLLNRQIVYTAITRTKGDTYILSSGDKLEEAKKTIITRDTNIN